VLPRPSAVPVSHQARTVRLHARALPPVDQPGLRDGSQATTLHLFAGLFIWAAAVGALALAGCQPQAPPAAGAPSDPPSGPIRPGEPIPYATLAEHLSFNTKSRTQLMSLRGQVVQVRGPVWKVQLADAGATLHFGSAQGSCVRAHICAAADVLDIREGQEVNVVGTFTFGGNQVLLENARLAGDNCLPARLMSGAPSRWGFPIVRLASRTRLGNIVSTMRPRHCRPFPRKPMLEPLEDRMAPSAAARGSGWPERSFSLGRQSEQSRLI
jgi:hypothetical protein